MSSAKNLQVSWKCEQYKALKLSAVQSLSWYLYTCVHRTLVSQGKKASSGAGAVGAAVMDTAEQLQQLQRSS